MSVSPLLGPADKTFSTHSGRMFGTASPSHRSRGPIPGFRSLTPALLSLAVGGIATILLAAYNFTGNNFDVATPFGSASQTGRHLRKCYPYHEPGQMLVDYSDQRKHTYVSYSGACPATNNLLSRLTHGHPPRHFQDKTILLLGDSVDAGLQRFFSGLPGGKFDLLPINPDVVDPPADFPRTDRVYFEAYNLTVGLYWFNGLDENDDWGDTEMIVGSGMWRDHFDKVALTWSGFKPDLIVSQFGLWDLARYQLKKITPSDHVENGYPGLQGRFVSDWRRSAVDFLEQLQEVFPHSSVLWRPVHHASTKHFWQGALVDGMNPLRVEQFRQLQVSVANEMKVPILPLDAMINFQADMFLDAFHPGETGNTIYAELVLAALDSVVDSGTGRY